MRAPGPDPEATHNGECDTAAAATRSAAVRRGRGGAGDRGPAAYEAPPHRRVTPALRRGGGVGDSDWPGAFQDSPESLDS